MNRFSFKTIKKGFFRILYARNPIKYARIKGVHIGVGNSFVDHPNFGSEPYLITIGNYNRISFGCAFTNHDGGRWVLDNLYPQEKPFLKFGAIQIGNNNFIGARTFINPGVTIGDNNVIAANSVITKNIPSNQVWGGIPAKFIMTIEEYKTKIENNKDQIDLEKLKTDKEKELIRVYM